MPRSETIVDIFISSPSDLQSERRVTEDVIAECNSTWSRERGVRLNSVTWEADTYPDIGEDAQAVINKQLGDSYDIFIGFVWARFGTPTRRAASGTEEEFNNALERHEADPENIKIMMYFKNAPIPVDSDPDQLRQVHRFRKRMEEIGVLYHQFNSPDDFAKLLRIHLGKQVQQWMRPSPKKEQTRRDKAETKDALAETTVSQEPDEEEGFLDLVEAGTASFEDLSRRSGDFASVIREYGEKTRRYTEELTALPTKPAKDIQARKRIIRKSAIATNKLAEEIEDFIPNFGDAYAAAMDSYGKAAALLVDFNPDDASQVKSALETVRHIGTSLRDSLEQISDFREAIDKTPRITTEFNRAKKRVVAALVSLEKEMNIGVNASEEVELLMGDVIEKIESKRQSAEYEVPQQG